MSEPRSVAVVQGGPSSEAEVSRASAASVLRALEGAHRVVRLELDARLPEALRVGGFDVVFPVTHGAVGEDGSLQGLLEVLGLPYVGSDVLASALAMDKRAARTFFAAVGLPIAPGLDARAPSAEEGPERRRSAARDVAERALAEVGDQLVVKPRASGSAIGVARFDGERPTTVDDVAAAVFAAWDLDDVALLERFARGREVTCGVLDVAGAPEPLPPTEIRASKDAFYTYEARYAPGRSEHECPARLGAAVTSRVQEVALAAHAALGCRDLCRVDMIVDPTAAGEPVTVLEVNTLPGFTDTSLFPEAAAIHGIPMPDLCARLVASALARGARRRNAARALPV